MKEKMTIIGLVMIITACSTQTSEESGTSANGPASNEQSAMSEAEWIEEGKRLVLALGCNDCHSPKKFTEYGPIPDETLLLSGHPSNLDIPDYDPSLVGSAKWMLLNTQGTAAVGPWGVSFASNLTPDETGTGNWTLEHFTKAMREGKYKGLENSRTLLPPMPWPGYQHLRDHEIEAIFKYLRSLSPVENVVPSPIPPKTVQ